MTRSLTVRDVFSHPAHTIGFGFGAGLVPRFPGTAGSVLAVLLYIPLSRLDLLWYLVLILAVTLVGIWAAGVSENYLGAKDPRSVVIDEIAGILIGFTLLPSGWIWYLVGFVVFRFLDVKKPWIIGMVDRRCSGGLGIMLDDVLAGLFTFLIVQSLAVVASLPFHTWFV